MKNNKLSLFYIFLLSLLFQAQSSLPSEENFKSSSSPSTQSSSQEKRVFSFKKSKGDITITSKTLELRSKDRVFVYKGDVKAVRGDLTIT
ncbi:MAG: hypothetical protein D6780_08315, partial [Candidatus Dadabacteria bacterium]